MSNASKNEQLTATKADICAMAKKIQSAIWEGNYEQAEYWANGILPHIDSLKLVDGKYKQ